MLLARLYGPRGWLALAAAALVVFVLFPVANRLVPADSAFHVSAYGVGLAGKIMCYMIVAVAMDLVWGYAGKGLRTTITVEGYWLKVLNDFLAIRIGQFFVIPTGLLLFVGLCAGCMALFLRTKTGTAMTAVGSNPIYARASGISVERMRTISVILSTLLGAIGILVYEQSFGFIQLYTAPFYMPLSAVAAILIGGASINKASMLNVVVGAFLFQGLLTMTPSVINSALQNDMSETLRIIVAYGMILYALTRKSKSHG